MAIRPPTASDVDRIRDLARRASCAPTMDWPALVDGGDLRVLTQDSALVGLLVLADRPDHLLIEAMIVDPTRSGHGFEKAILTFAESEARNRGHDAVEIPATAAANGSLALCRSLGYREMPRPDRDGERAVRLRKTVL